MKKVMSILAVAIFSIGLLSIEAESTVDVDTIDTAIAGDDDNGKSDGREA